MKKNKLILIGMSILITLIIVSFIGPLFLKQNINSVDLYNISSPPSSEHLLGTDDLGRDVLARLLYGGRVSLLVGVFATMLQVIIGSILGILAGYFGGIVDTIIMRNVDIVMCFPFFIVAIALAAIVGPSVVNLIVIIAVLSWTDIARIVRAEVLSIKERDFIMASKAIGFNNFDIILKHIIPNILSSILVAMTLSMATAILMEASLSFLGMGVKPPMPSWGNMLTAAQNMRTLSSEWWLWIPPGFMIIVSVLAINFLGEGLRKKLDPKKHL
ncbi:ABC transporter permease [Romboutsia sp. 1001216sp1]|uniref:oligopeptide ABC transporter permease n=1 Tax=unclassified Romboutsia TaxID=2626894 RepID=UPI001FAD5731|nr:MULTISPECIES: oligopeptide ABC transporter permease [unclassified Romboutsia]MDB8791973.1 ABC transporter permease [Romboutsia sp. 1001216sp1]MDB8801755.1 ABC transporter permease [Romboutsia sp. 1001216sp1]MDB8813151.1 ABC transporter permease [Romboutsia sp. 1001216sp1]